MKLTKEMLIDWIDRPPSNSDLDLINYIIDLQNNRDKAIEYIKENATDENGDIGINFYASNTYELLDILRGSSDE